MSDAWNLHLDDGVLTVELTAGIESAEFERLYDGIVQEITAVEVVVGTRRWLEEGRPEWFPNARGAAEPSR